MINKQEVQHIAKLARLGLTDPEIEKFQKDLSAILDYFEKLKKVDISGVEPTSHSVPRQKAGMAVEDLAILVENLVRKDEIKEEEIETRKKLIEQAPEAQEGYFKVKSIL